MAELVEGARLEIVCVARHRGFESHSLRQIHLAYSGILHKTARHRLLFYDISREIIKYPDIAAPPLRKKRSFLIRYAGTARLHCFGNEGI